MNKADIKNAIGKLSPDKEIELRLSEKILHSKPNRLHFKHMSSIAASIVVVVSLGIFGHTFIEKKPAANTTSSSTMSSEGGIYIPKIELPKNTNEFGQMKSFESADKGTVVSANMLGVIVYQGRMYDRTFARINPKNAEELKGEKLGTTKGNLSEWSEQKDYEVEFASSIGKTDVFSVRGYDKNFRIMTYDIRDGKISPVFFECFNGITVKTGADIFDKLKIENNIIHARQEMTKSLDYKKEQYSEIKDLSILNSFVKELRNTFPYTRESLPYLNGEQGNTNQKFVYLDLNDGTEVLLMLYKGGYVGYVNAHIFFKMESEAFNKFWASLE